MLGELIEHATYGAMKCRAEDHLGWKRCGHVIKDLPHDNIESSGTSGTLRLYSAEKRSKIYKLGS